eukprot:scaffold233_cov198-Chaetoceros_neogracile.AAC.2
MEGEDEATKVEARQFMSDVLPTTPSVIVTEDATAGNCADMAAWKSTYASSSSSSSGSNTASNTSKKLMEEFWTTHYDPDATSIWKMVYDETDCTEDMDEAKGIVTAFMANPGMLLMEDQCFGIMHTLEGMEIEGLWFFNGPDPEQLFGANEDTSWYTWSQLGPAALDNVKIAVASFLTPIDGKLNGKSIKDTKIF